MGANILAQLDRRGWTLGALSAKSGLNKGYLSQLTRGQVENPGTKTLGKIAEALGVPLSEILARPPGPPLTPSATTFGPVPLHAVACG